MRRGGKWVALATVIAAVLPVVPLGDQPLAVASASQEVRPVTPVLSLRRISGVVSRVVADHRLNAELEQAMNDPELQGARENTCLVVRDPDGRTIYARRPGIPLIPASTLKLITGAVALKRIGADTRLVTEVRASSPPNTGAVDALWMVGGGDPMLATQDYAAVAGFLRQPRLATPAEQLADRVVQAGIRSVGVVVGDDSRYDNQRYVPTWKPRYITDFEITPISALVVNRGFLSPTPPTPAPSSTAHAAGMLTTLLRARGVTVGADPQEGAAPPGSAFVASIESPPLGEVVGDMLQNSDNLAAEMLIKELGKRFGGAGSTGAGLSVVSETLPQFGLSSAEIAAVDGSGLDRANRLSCQTLQQLWAAVGEGSDLAARLPVAGGRGTLIKRFLGSPAEGKVRAKTGSLDFVVGLSGWATTAHGRSIQFSLLANELPRTAVGLVLEDRVVNVLVRYPDGPPPETIAPAPPVPAPRS